jgi:F0F1-type ATP synthase delta subunit
MLFREIIAVYCENHTEHINTLCGQNGEFSSYLTGNTLRLRYKAHRLMLFKEIIAVYGENHTEHTNNV